MLKVLSLASISCLMFEASMSAQTLTFLQTQGVTLSGTPNLGTSFGAIVVSDLNNDGKPDVAALDNGIVYILLNQGTGLNSLASVTYNYVLPPPGASFSSLAVADVNGDGKQDLIISASDYAQGLLVMLGNGDGTFQSPVSTPFALQMGCCPVFATGDFNGDHQADLAITGGGGSVVDILPGNGNGTFGTPITYPATSTNATRVIAADFDGDGNLDIAIAGTGIAVLLGNGDGTFRSPIITANNLTFSALTTADTNGDGKLDLIGTYFSGNDEYFEVFLGNGDGTFQPATPGGIVCHPGCAGVTLAAADLGKRGKVDLIAGGVFQNMSTPNVVTVWTGNGDGTFGSPTIYPLTSGGTGAFGTYYSNPVVADLNSDGLPDIAVNTVNMVTVLYNSTPTEFSISGSRLAPSLLSSGEMATSAIALTTIAGLKQGASLSCSVAGQNASSSTLNLPSCSLSPASLPSGSGSSTLTVITTAPASTLTRPASGIVALFYSTWLPMTVVLVTGYGGRMRLKLRKLMLLGLVLTNMLVLPGCGGSRKLNGGTSPGTYIVTVTGTIGAISHSTTLQFSVE